jgi:uncharacterized membrane protein
MNLKNINGMRWSIPLYGLALVLLLVLGSVLMVSHPVVWEKVHRSAMKGKLKEMHYEDANKITGGLWTEEPYQEISNSLKFRKMNEKEIHHYEDVRGLLGAARVVVIVCVILVMMGCFWAGWRTIWRASFAIFLSIGVIFGIWMFIDWHSLFKALHWAVFWDDSWKLPNTSYSLGLFPHRVWQLAGGVIGGMVLVALLIPVIFRRY